MHKEGLCAKKWIKNGPNLEDKTMLFLITQRTLQKKNLEKPSHAPTTV